jgi:hypothetical protein
MAMGPHGLRITQVSNLYYRKPRISDLGKVFSIIYQANEQAVKLSSEIDEDLRMFHAPSECADIAYRGCDQIVLDAIKTAEAVTGMKWQDIYDEIYARTGGRWFSQFMYQSLVPQPGQED